ncbi:cytochrome b [Flavobacterium sp. W21_SRS_FM6]|uniref:cytochrome b n=1 Tax=Flavobacterium sp. W21_SRS_FM6 TaxID=3240268 RepID=UPI003F90A1A7
MMQKQYSPLSVWLHWLMLILLAGVYASIELRGLFERGTEARDLIKTTHYLLGLSIFTLVWFRILVRLVTPTPERETYGAFQQWASKLMFLALYGLMIAMPLLGWTLVSAEGHIIHIFSWSLPQLVEENKELALQIEEIHETMGKLGYVLIGIHAVAGLFHHFIKKDGTLKRMLKFKG